MLYVMLLWVAGVREEVKAQESDNTTPIQLSFYSLARLNKIH
jgi:hypothetical protein